MTPDATPPASSPAAKYDITIDTSETPELSEWAEKELRPVVEAWYPKIVEMLPSDGFEAPRKLSITFRKDKEGVADTGGTRINCAANWFRHNLKGEAKGAVVHEIVHVVQQYGRAGPATANAPTPAGWWKGWPTTSAGTSTSRSRTGPTSATRRASNTTTPTARPPTS